ASRRTRRPLTEEVVLVHGAGAGGVGVAQQVIEGLVDLGLSREEAKARVYVVDSRGLVLSGRPGLEPYKAAVAHDPASVAGWAAGDRAPTLLETVRRGKVTVLLGLSGQGGAFGRDVVEAALANTPTPIVF